MLLVAATELSLKLNHPGLSSGACGVSRACLQVIPVLGIVTKSLEYLQVYESLQPSRREAARSSPVCYAGRLGRVRT